VSTLSDSLKELQLPRKKPSNFKLWLDSLSAEDRQLAIEAILDERIKKYPLFDAFRRSGMQVAKDTFFDVRQRLIEGTMQVEEIQ
jgi:hypothetical protein